MEVADLSELCRLCLDSSNVLFPFDTSLSYTPKSLPQLIKFCLDIDCRSNDGGIAPKNLCQSCLDKLQIVFEFKSKSQESEKYLKQIISHSAIDQPDPQNDIIEDEPIIPYSNYPDDEESLLQPMDDDYEEQHNGSAVSMSISMNSKLPRRGNRTGEFQCQICFKSFRYVKALNNHMKMHKQQKSTTVSYYKRKKMMQAAGLVKSPPKAAAPRFKREPQPEYDSISPYNSPAPYDDESPAQHQRDLSPDFGALMLSTSQMINDEVEAEQEIPKTSRTGRPLKRPITDDELYKPNGSGQKRTRTRPSIPPKKSPAALPAKAPPKKVEEEVTKRPGPASKTRVKATPLRKKSEDAEEGFAIEGFSEVDITKMLKKSKKRDNMIEMIDDESQKSSSASTRSRSRSPSVELIPEVDIFGRG